MTASGGSTVIERENHDGVAVVRMARGRGNALNIALLEALDECILSVERSDAKALVLTGQGNVFGAGVDLPELLAGGEDYVRRFLPILVQVFERLATFAKPAVAAINGHAIAGGAILAFCCDQKILAKGKATIGLSEIVVGVPFPAWALEIARFAVPPAHFQSIVCTGRGVSADDARAMSLVDELVEPDQLLPRALEVAHELGNMVPEVYRFTKEAVRRPMIEAVRQTEPNDKKVFDLWCSESVQRSIKAFAERMLATKK